MKNNYFYTLKKSANEVCLSARFISEKVGYSITANHNIRLDGKKLFFRIAIDSSTFQHNQSISIADNISNLFNWVMSFDNVIANGISKDKLQMLFKAYAGFLTN